MSEGEVTVDILRQTKAKLNEEENATGVWPQGCALLTFSLLAFVVADWQFIYIYVA